MRTVVNIQAGGRSALSGLIRSGILLVVILLAAGLTEPIPLAVLAGITIRVGLSIIDWSFLKRAHHVSWKGALIMYGVVGLTVFVDLITAVGIGVFVANILTIQRLSDLREKDVRAITDADDEILLNDEEKDLLRLGHGRILLFHLSGPMIFGVAKAISRQHMALEDHDVLILDLSDVPMIGVTSSLALENAIKEACEQRRQVFIVGAASQIKWRLERLGVFDLIPSDHLLMDRRDALRRAVAFVSQGSRNSTGEIAETEQLAPGPISQN